MSGDPIGEKATECTEPQVNCERHEFTDENDTDEDDATGEFVYCAGTGEQLGGEKHQQRNYQDPGDDSSRGADTQSGSVPLEIRGDGPASDSRPGDERHQGSHGRGVDCAGPKRSGRSALAFDSASGLSARADEHHRGRDQSEATQEDANREPVSDTRDYKFRRPLTGS